MLLLYVSRVGGKSRRQAVTSRVCITVFTVFICLAAMGKKKRFEMKWERSTCYEILVSNPGQAHRDDRCNFHYAGHQLPRFCNSGVDSCIRQAERRSAHRDALKAPGMCG